MILLIDNYDSFVFNLARYFGEMGCEWQVVRNDAITVDEVRALNPAAIVLSPGPCTPREAGISMSLVQQLGETIPMLGVCLGHQAIAAALGAKIVRAKEPMHGRSSQIQHDGKGLFRGLPNPLTAARYHSLTIDEQSLPREFTVTARTVDGQPMAIAHASWRVHGVQFHPESVLTEAGHRLLANFLELAGISVAQFPTGDVVVSPAEPDVTEPFAPNGQPVHW